MSNNNARPKILVCGYSGVGYACLNELIASGANIAALFTHEDNKNENIWFKTPKEAAIKAQIPVYYESLSSPNGLKIAEDIAPDIIFSFYYRDILPASLLAMPRLGAFNMHGSLLPKYRGRVPVHWAIINGETKTGATLHVMEKTADTGDIIGQAEVPILYEDTSRDVMEKVAEAARSLIAEYFAPLEAGTAKKYPQDHTKATKYGGRKPEDGLIDTNKTPTEIYNLVRALTKPYPGAFYIKDGKKIYVWKVKPIENVYRQIGIEEHDLIYCNGGAVKILDSSC